MLAGTSHLHAQTSLPAVTVDAPKPRQARPAAVQPAQRTATSRARRASRAASAPQAAPPRFAATDGPGAGERADGPVSGYVATRSATGTKTDTPLIETPQSVSVVTADQIRTQGAQTLGATLRYSAGIGGEVNGSSDTRNGVIQVRGIDIGYQGLFRDGLRLPSTRYVSFLPLSPYGAERIEVLKGPASVLFGQGSVGGILNYVSKLPTARQFGEMSISGGSFNRYQGEFDVGGPANKDGSVLWRLTGLVRDGNTQVDFTKDNQVFIAPAVTFRNEDTSLTLLANYQQDRTGWGLQFLPASGTVFPNAGRIIPVNRFVGEPGFNNYDTDQAAIGYRLSHNFSEVLTFRQNLSYAWLKNKERSFYGTGYANEAAAELNRFGDDAVSTIGSFAVDNQLQAKFDTGFLSHTTLFGIDYRSTNFADTAASLLQNNTLNVFAPVYTNSFSYLGPYDDSHTHQKQVGLYAQEQMKLGRLSVVLGGRQDFATTDVSNFNAGTYVTRDDKAFTGRAAAIYNFDSGIAPYVSYSESFLPVLDRDVSGQLLAPETGKAYEAGVKYQPVGVNALLTLAAFDITRGNVVRFQPIPPFAARQTGEITSRGFDAELIASPLPGLNVRGGYAYVDSIVSRDPDGGNEGKVPTTVPKNRVSLWGDYTLQTGQFSGVQFGGGVRYVGSTFGDDANTFKVPEATVADALLAYTRGGYRFALNVTNIFDKRHVAACYTDTGCFYAEGRKAIAKLTYRW